jgi:acid phosphatase
MRPITRRRALTGLAGVALGSLTASWARAAGDGALTFLAVGDWGRDGAFHQAEVGRQMGLTAQAIGAAFVISAGDNFYEDGVFGLDDPKWRTSFEAVYDHPALQVPWHVALGNHDYHGNTEAQIAYSARSRRWRLPARHYVRRERAPDGTTLKLVVIDTSPFVSKYHRPDSKVQVEGQDAAAQLAWLDGALARSDADWTIVVGHHPIWSGREDSDAAPDLRATVDPILRRHRVRLYVNGHDHDLMHVEKDGAHYVCTGAGSKMDEACEAGDFCSLASGFTAYRLTRDRLEVAYRAWTGAELDVVSIARA